MEEALHQKVVGQDEAIRSIAKAVRRARAGLKDPRRPIGVFMFLGPTGVGKTFVARVLSEFMFGSEDSMIKLDMSEFMEKHNVSRLIGAPPGYVGYEDAGQLTDTVRRKSYCLVLLDEIEKATLRYSISSSRSSMTAILQTPRDERWTSATPWLL